METRELSEFLSVELTKKAIAKIYNALSPKEQGRIDHYASILEWAVKEGGIDGGNFGRTAALKMLAKIGILLATE